MLAAPEAALRVYQWSKFEVPLQAGPGDLERFAEQGLGSRLSYLIRHDALGWQATPNYTRRGPARNADGSVFELNMSQDSRGFRRFGDPSSDRPRVMVIGDSFTQAVLVSDDQTYYAVLADRLGAEVFAYGGSAFGTLQEYMILDR